MLLTSAKWFFPTPLVLNAKSKRLTPDFKRTSNFERTSAFERQRRVPIPAWGNAPGMSIEGSRAESPHHKLVPHITLVIFDIVLVEKSAKLLLESPGEVVLLLVVDVIQQRLPIS